jgi:Beta-lactamase
MAAFYTDPPQAPYWPKQHWRTSTPEAQGMDSAKLSAALEFAHATSLPLHSVTVIRHGALVLDASFYPYGPGMLHNGASITKSVISALVGLAVHKGHIRSVAQPVLECFPDRTVPNLDAHKRAMTVEHLLTMTSGLDCGFTPTEAELFEMLAEPALGGVRAWSAYEAGAWHAFRLLQPWCPPPGGDHPGNDGREPGGLGAPVPLRAPRHPGSGMAGRSAGGELRLWGTAPASARYGQARLSLPAPGNMGWEPAPAACLGRRIY